MNSFWLPLLVLLPVPAGILVMTGALKNRSLKLWFLAVVFAFETVGVLLLATHDFAPVTLFRFTSTISITLAVDKLTKLFAVVFGVIWLPVGIFAFRYMTHEHNEDLFFGFYLICEGMLLGVSMAENLITLYLFYEMVSLLSVPLVLHSRTREAITAALKYMFYSVGGAFLALFGLFVLAGSCTTLSFAPGGTLDMAAIAGREGLVRTAAFLAVLGFGVKAGLFPLHAWLPTAHPVAPAPASAVLSGIITKVGVIATIRMIYCLVGADFLAGTWVQHTWLILSLLTVFLGSMMAFREPVLKKRLAFSTVSQVSYVLTGIFLLCPEGMTGSLLHVIFHASIKVCLFLAAGEIIFQTGKTRVEELRGIGKTMPITLWSFTFASLALIGIPPFSGFVSKWYLALGSLGSGVPTISWLAPAILLVSALLTFGYLLPITIKGFFPGKDYNGPTKAQDGSALMWIPVALLALFTLLSGVCSRTLVELAQGIARALM